jgi:hypothetical protein
VLHRRVWEDQEKALGLEHPDTLSNMSNLAKEVGGQGSHRDGGMLDRRAVASGENPIGPASTSTKLGACKSALSVFSSGFGWTYPRTSRELDHHFTFLG